MRLSLEDLPFRLKRKFHKTVGTRYVRSRYGVVMRANWHDVTFRMCYAGSYGSGLSDLLTRYPRDFLFLDIGANQGLYSLIAARNQRCRHAYAFEPVPDTFAILRDNITRNGLESRVTAIDSAVSDKTGTASITLSAAHSGASSLGNATSIERGTIETVRTMDMAGVDALLPPSGEDIVVKIDVEGHEAVVIEQLMASRNRDRVTRIFYEVDENWSDASGLEDRLRVGGFSKFQRYGSGTHYDVLALRE